MSQKAFATLSLLTLLQAVPIFAETPLKANIPFDFTAGHTRMSAGQYTVVFDKPGTLWIVRDDRKASCAIMTMAVQAAKTPEVGKLVFNNYGGSLFLSKIFSPGYDQGRQLSKSKVELEVARRIGGAQLASVRATPR
jgi:hypothetical protein